MGPRPADLPAGVKQNTQVLCNADVGAVAAALARLTGEAPDAAFMRDFRGMWERANPAAPAARLIAAIRENAHLAAGKRRPHAYLREVAVNALNPACDPPAPRGPSWDEYVRDREREAARALLADPDTPADMRALWRDLVTVDDFHRNVENEWNA